MELAAGIAGEGFRKDVGDCRGSGGDVTAVVLAEKTGEGGSDLRLGNGTGVRALAERRGVRADDGHPDIFRTFLFGAMVFPLGEAAAAAVIGGDNESGLIAIRGDGLHGVPKLLDEMIDVVSAVEHEVVTAGVGPVVRFAVADKQDFGLLGADVIEQGHLLEGVVDVFLVEFRGVKVEFVDELLLRGESSAIGQVPADLDGEMVAADVEDILERGPGGEDCDLVAAFGLLVEPFEYGRIRVGAEFVGVDFWIRGAGEHFVVAGKRKGLAVGDVSDAAFGLVTDDLASRGDDAPEKGKERLAAIADVVAPEFVLEAFRLAPDAAAFGIEKRGIGAGENLLPAEAVGDDEDNVAGFGLGLRGESACEQQSRKGEEYDEGESASVHDWSFLFRQMRRTRAPNNGAASVC